MEVVDLGAEDEVGFGFSLGGSSPTALRFLVDGMLLIVCFKESVITWTLKYCMSITKG